MHFSMLIWYSSIFVALTAAAVPDFLYLGEIYEPHKVRLFGGISVDQQTKGQANYLNYSPHVDLGIGPYLSTSALPWIAAAQTEIAHEFCTFKFVYKISTKGIEDQFHDSTYIQLKKGMLSSYPQEEKQEWVTTSTIPVKNVLGYYLVMPQGKMTDYVDLWDKTTPEIWLPKSSRVGPLIGIYHRPK